MCRFPAKKVVWVLKCAFWFEFHQFFCPQIGLGSNHTHQSKKKGCEKFPLKDKVRVPVCWAKIVHFWKPWKQAFWPSPECREPPICSKGIPCQVLWSGMLRLGRGGQQQLRFKKTSGSGQPPN